MYTASLTNSNAWTRSRLDEDNYNKHVSVIRYTLCCSLLGESYIYFLGFHFNSNTSWNELLLRRI